MVSIFAVNINDEAAAPIDLLCELISSERQNKIKRFRFEDDKKRSLYGELLVRAIYASIYDCESSRIKINYNDYGKPYIVSDSEPLLKYNLSHSGDWVLCGISDSEIGVDIERVDNCMDGIAERFFTAEEQEYIRKRSKDDLEGFYQIWCAKECYMKWTGKGLAIPMDSFTCDIKRRTIFDNNLIQEVRLHTCALDKGYQIMICCEEQQDYMLPVERMSLKKIVSSL